MKRDQFRMLYQYVKYLQTELHESRNYISPTVDLLGHLYGSTGVEVFYFARGVLLRPLAGAKYCNQFVCKSVTLQCTQCR